jgi:glucokinase
VGSLEAYASATGIAITANELLSSSTEESLLRRYKPDEIDSKAVYDCAMQGDAIAKKCTGSPARYWVKPWRIS